MPTSVTVVERRCELTEDVAIVSVRVAGLESPGFTASRTAWQFWFLHGGNNLGFIERCRMKDGDLGERVPQGIDDFTTE